MSTELLTIRALDARPVIVPLERPIRTAVGTIPAAPLVLIDVTTEEGITGRAYVFGYTPLTLAPLGTFLGNIAETLQGKSVVPVERMREFERMFRLLGRQGLVGMALSGVDMALWDALGQAHSQPVVRLADAILTDAVKREASDIHFEPEHNFLRIRYRVDGMLRQVRSLHKSYWPAMAVRIKVMSGISTELINLIVLFEPNGLPTGGAK